MLGRLGVLGMVGRLGLVGPIVLPMLPMVPADAAGAPPIVLTSGFFRVSFRDALMVKVIQPLEATPFMLMAPLPAEAAAVPMPIPGMEGVGMEGMLGVLGILGILGMEGMLGVVGVVGRLGVRLPMELPKPPPLPLPSPATEREMLVNTPPALYRFRIYLPMSSRLLALPDMVTEEPSVPRLVYCTLS